MASKDGNEVRDGKEESRKDGNEVESDHKLLIFSSNRCTIRNRIICIIVVAVVVLVLVVLVGFLIWYFTRSRDKSSGGPYEKEAVATDTKACSDIGVDILDAKGSGVDAAIAAMFCLGVINMHSSGIGGGGVMMVYNRTLKEAKVFDFRETAPATTTPNMFQPGSDEIKKGGLAIAVPGEVHGQYQAWKQYGWLPWKDLVQPAIDLARKGVPLSAAVAEALSNTNVVKSIKEDAGLSELLLDKNGNPYKKGDPIKNEKYAMTLEKIQKDPESFYNGELARTISQDMIRIPKDRNKGKVTENDLRNYQTTKREPLESKLSGMKMYLTPPPTSGAVLGLILNILKGYNMTSSDRDGTTASVLTYHRIIEAFKFGYAWRSRLGDPRFNSDKKINEIAQQMLGQTLANKIRQKIQDDRTHDVSYYAQFFSDADFGTTHLSVLAPNGDAVAVTTTINYWFGCLYRSNITGIIYNNQMADFDIPGTKEVDGVYPSEVNYPDSNKRPFSSMSPAILTDNNGDVQLVIGASGGKKITTAISLVLMNKLWFEKSLSDAVDEPRLHEQLVPDMTVEIENEKYRLDSKIVEGLEDLGHEVNKTSTFAVVQAVYRKPGDGIYAKSDPRKYGEPSGG